MTRGEKLRVAVLGASGFTGKECLHWLAMHPEVEIANVMSTRGEEAGEPRSAETYRGAMREPAQEPLDRGKLTGLDAVFLCTPHLQSAEFTPQLMGKVGCVIDLSAAFRLTDPTQYPKHYGFEHPAPELLDAAVYGLTEWARNALPGAKLVANPGCYVTSVLLPLKALFLAKVLDGSSDVIADCKSGLSGAGKSLSAVTHFASVCDDFRAYGVGTHRHEPEIREHADFERVFFTPHLLPVFRGILSTLHVRPAAGRTASDLREALAIGYQEDPFVEVLAEGEGLPCIQDTQRSNVCKIGVAPHGDRAVVVSTLDNLVKGAAGQAIQNFNLVFGLEESLGLSVEQASGGAWR